MAAGRERLVIGAEQFRVLISGKSILAETTHEAKIEVRLSAEVNWRALAHALVDSERLADPPQAREFLPARRKR
jgi:hypothetical protein